MPWMIPSHQAPALSLKLWRPRLFSGLALCLGSMAPDLEFILRLDDDWIVSHTLAAQVYFTAPLVVILYALAAGLVLPWLLPLLPPGAPFHREQLAALRLPRTVAGWLSVATSGCIGGLTHVLLDSVTHGNHSGWLVPLLPVLRLPVPSLGGPIPLHDALQLWLSLLLGLAACAAWSGIARQGLLWRWRGEPPASVFTAPRSERVRAARWLSLWMLAGASAACGLRPVHDLGHGAEMATYGCIAFMALGLVLFAASDRLVRSAKDRSYRHLRHAAITGP
jgi:hypothetical protein